MYMYGKKNKNKNKNYCRKSVILSLSSRSVDFIDFRVDSQVDVSCLRWQIILSLMAISQFAYARAIQITGKTDFF